MTYDRLDFDLEDTISANAPFHTTSFVYRRSLVPDFPRWLSEVYSPDMLLYVLVAEQGRLRRIPDVMSAYRVHHGGITKTAMHSGMRIHANRLYMHLCIRRHLDGRCRNRSNEVIRFHAERILGGATARREKIRRLRDAIRAEPKILMFPAAWVALTRVVLQVLGFPGLTIR